MIGRKKAAAAELGQMAVELAVTLPVLLVALVIAIDGILFVGHCAKFDHLAAQAVLANATSPARGSYDEGARTAAVKAALAGSFTSHNAAIEVSASSAGVSSMTAFTCTLKMSSWPLSGASLFGMQMPQMLTHQRVLVVDAYTPGRLL